MNEKKTGLVLEGGGLRGIFTAGVLDFFLEKNMKFDRCIGVSAGSCHACSYLSGQYKRAYNVSVDYLDDKRYCSIYSLIKTGDLFGADFLYREIPDVLNPIDNETYLKNNIEFQAVITNCRTGKAEYPYINDMRKDVNYIRASSSLPFLSRMVEIKGEVYLDGGISDPIPIRKSIENGNTKNVIIMTRDRNYRKKQSKLGKISAMIYKKYPELVKLMDTRFSRYNETLKYIYEQEKMGNVFIIQPENPLNLGRIEKNKEKLTNVYNKGYKEAEKRYKKLVEYLTK
ncbi:patatin family protein [Leptotrichia sp. OH3620_COT-345]|uniref:patatin-like phospholipase family protein n=1 Tax=Leptotrichia sp. OH3620_COT-345 TaxID=2491048 RepID=UPI000F64E5CD|nr:patatin family protein [Leptotrichia sp. OH3620_COT-345]RRD40441.1 patatin family protein [Leptotrichia sp. OH3620_COT-345]